MPVMVSPPLLARQPFSQPRTQGPACEPVVFRRPASLPWSVKIDASYVGSRTYDINTGDNQTGGARNINANTAEQIARFQQDPNYFNQQVANPFQGLLPGNSLNAATVTRGQLLKPSRESRM